MPLFGVLTQTNTAINWRWFKEEQLGIAPTIFHNTSSVTDMLQHLNWETLESRRTKLQLVMMYKIISDLVDIPCDAYLTPATTLIRAIHLKTLLQYPTRTDTFKFSFSPRTIPVWNSLPAPVAEAPDLVLFKHGLSSLSHSKLGRGQSVSRIRGFWSCAGWATIPRGSYCSRIGLLPNEDSNM